MTRGAAIARAQLGCYRKLFPGAATARYLSKLGASTIEATRFVRVATPRVFAYAKPRPFLYLQAVTALFVSVRAVRSVISHVRRMVSNQHEVLDHVVEPVAVPVVDNLSAQEHPSDMLFHDVSVFKHAPTIWDNDIAVAIVHSAAFPSSMIRAAANETFALETTKPGLCVCRRKGSAAVFARFIPSGFSHAMALLVWRIANAYNNVNPFCFVVSRKGAPV